MKPKHASYIVLALLVFVVRVSGEEPTRFARDRPVDCIHIKLDLNVDVNRRTVGGTATLDMTALRKVTSVRLDAVDLRVSRVTVARGEEQAAEAAFVNDGEHLEILLGEPLDIGDGATVKITYALDNPREGLYFFGPSEDEPDVPLVVWSEGQSIYNRYWFPSFDHPDELQTTEIIVTTRRGLSASSNGRLIAKTEDADKNTVTFHWLQDQPHVSYLVSLIVGDFFIVRDNWRGKPVTYWVHQRYKDQVEGSFKNTKRMLDFFSEKFDIEYPWDRYAQISCEGYSGGGMENTSATTLGNGALHDQRSLLDSNSDGLIAHEIAHQWWGDMLTCRDWAHLWLNEGFATYSEALWAEHDLGDDEFRYNMFRKATNAIRGGKERPMVDRAYETPDAMFDSRTYSKGAWVLHMIRKRLGDELFWQSINKYGTDNAFRTVETVDLRKSIEETTGRSFERFFYDWTQRPGHPELSVSYEWLSDDKLAKVMVTQTQEANAFHFPLELEFRFADDTPPVNVTRDMTDKQVSFLYPLPQEPELFRIDPAHTVLMELETKQGRNLWKAQLLSDPDPIARIRAAEHFGESSSDRNRRLLAQALKNEPFWGVQRGIAAALGDIGGDIARDALIEGVTFADHNARRACVEQLDSFHRDPLAIVAVQRIVEKGDPSYHVEAAAIQSYAKLQADDTVDVLVPVLSRDSRQEIIRSAVLRSLGSLPDPKVIPVLVEWTRPDKPRLSRPIAISGLASITQEVPVDAPSTQLIVDALTECLDDTGLRVRRSAVQALGDLAEPGKARSALPALRSLASNEPDFYLRETVKETIEAIESAKPAQDHFAELRQQLNEARELNEELSDRVGKLEAMIETHTKAGKTTTTQEKAEAGAGSGDGR